MQFCQINNNKQYLEATLDANSKKMFKVRCFNWFDATFTLLSMIDPYNLIKHNYFIFMEKCLK